MKNTRHTLTLLTACAALPFTGLFAQAPATTVPSATPSVSAPARTAADGAEAEDAPEAGGKLRARLASLTPEEKQKLRAANKAATQDPAVQAAKAERKTNPRAFRQARRAAMIKADPSVEPILEKLKEERHPGKNL